MHSLAPPTQGMSTTATASSSELTKQRQVSHLSQQLAVLHQRTEQLASLSVTTAEQVSYMRLLAAHHAGWFMSAGSVMVPGENEDANENA